MDAREKWIEAAEKLAEQMVLLDSCSAMSVGNGDNKYEEEFIDKRAQLFAHLRTTPEGFALVPVPEWVKVADGLPVVPEGESVLIWITDGVDVWENTYENWHPSVSRICSATHWQYKQDDTPAPPEEA